MNGHGPGTGIFAGFAGNQVITNSAAMLTFECLAGLHWPRWQLSARALSRHESSVKDPAIGVAISSGSVPTTRNAVPH